MPGVVTHHRASRTDVVYSCDPFDYPQRSLNDGTAPGSQVSSFANVKLAISSQGTRGNLKLPLSCPVNAASKLLR